MVHDARRVVFLAKSATARHMALGMAAVLIATCGSGMGADDSAPAAAKPAFEAGDISIGEPIALPFARPKAATGTTSAAEAAVPAAPGQGWLGITVAESNVPGRWTVAEVAPKSPATAAGINPGDEVRAIGGLPLRNADDVAQALTSIAPGQEVRLAIAKGEQVSDITLTAIPRPAVAARSLPSLPADVAEALARPAADGAAAATPPAAPAEALSPLPVTSATPPSQAEPLTALPLDRPAAPAVSLPAAPPAAAAATPSTELLAAPPAPAFAAAPPIGVDATAVADPPVSSPRFPRAAAAAEPAVAPAPRFEPTAAFGEPPAGASQPASTAGGRIALGVRTIPIDPGMQARFNLPAASGAYVIGVVGDLPASKAGVPPGSVIVALDERPVRSPDELTRLVTSGPVGKPVPLEYVLPGGTSRRAEVVLQTLEQPLEEALVGPKTAASLPALQPQPAPTVARRQPDTDEAAMLRDEIRRLEARLDAIERRLTGR